MLTVCVQCMGGSAVLACGVWGSVVYGVKCLCVVYVVYGAVCSACVWCMGRCAVLACDAWGGVQCLRVVCAELTVERKETVKLAEEVSEKNG